MPVSATVDAANTVLHVTFDSPLQPAVLDKLSWQASGNGFRLWVDAAAAAGSIVTLQVRPKVFPTSIPKVSYLDLVSDLKSLGGTPAHPFADFPVTVIP